MDKETILICNKDECLERFGCNLSLTHSYGCLCRKFGKQVVKAWLDGRCYRKGKLIPWEDYCARYM